MRFPHHSLRIPGNFHQIHGSGPITHADLNGLAPDCTMGSCLRTHVRRAGATRTIRNMLGRTGIVLFALVGVLSFVGGCTPEYNTATAERCTNGKTDGDETDVDCGGSCKACEVTQRCNQNADCGSGTTCIENTQNSVCPEVKDDPTKISANCRNNATCFDTDCHDNKQDNGETDVDCGGGSCPTCKATQHCQQSSDCKYGNPCLQGTCYDAGCNNGKQDGNETGVDCGGDQCPACEALSGCKTTSDCKTGNTCIGSICYGSTCENKSLDAPETDIDCGGGVCPACAASKHCVQNTDCTTGNVCIAGTCYVDTCSDDKIDASETDKDCGGPDCPVCTKGKTCNSSSDCEDSTPCTNNKCGDPKCFDGTQDESETDKDCGGTCAPCAVDKNCNVHADCETLNCSGGTCKPATCSDGSQNQGESGVDCGDPNNQCDRCDTGKTCTDDANCASIHCFQGYCVAATCEDGIRNGKETAKDCGGGCKACPDNSPCSNGTDCESGVCWYAGCKAPSCSDGVQNGQETGKDCGGSCLLVSPPQTCPNGQGCATNADCAFNNCAAFVCQPPTCANSVQDPTETDKDCGGSCSPCADNLKCVQDSDCQSKVCDPNKKICNPPTCSDTAQNGNETDLNCGGVTCTQRCTTGQKCLANADCVSKVCRANAGATGGTCSAPTCDDSAQNGDETGFNCGGSCALMSPAKTCGTDVGCNGDADCTSNNCCIAASCGASVNKCVAPSCADGKKNQSESGIDCGGEFALNPTSTCKARCGAGQSCNSASDCDSGVCPENINVCQAPTCKDNVKNGNESGPDCGAACQPNLCSNPTTCLCGTGVACNGPGDCQSGVCSKDINGNYTTCAAATCTDGIRNGSEPCLADHGGGCPNYCPQGSACNIKADCDPTVANIDCILNICSVPSCKDTAIDGDETDTDCGGSCGPCENGKKCKVVADCTSLSCSDDGTGTKRCKPATCTDTIQNQGESGVDCGGTGNTCNKCDTGFGCTGPADCVNGVCGADNKCAAPTCSDGVQNQQETDISGCGGPNCRSSTTACDAGRVCKDDLDCKDLWCLISSGTTGICTVPSCTDTYQNGSESDKDCGGICSLKCADGLKCNKDADCAHGWCNSGKCATPACTDGIKNGTETGTDCGSNCATSCATAYDSNCKQCGDGSGCSINNDCKSLSCGTGSTCAAPSGTTAAACVGKVLDGTCNSKCDTAAGVDAVKCRNVLWCIYSNNCSNPGTVSSSGSATYANCTDGGVNGPCSVNKLPSTPSTTVDAAIKAFRCACP